MTRSTNGRSARNITARVLTVAGVVLLLFAMAWWAFAVKRLLRLPEGLDFRYKDDYTVERVAGGLGLKTYSPALKSKVVASGRMRSADEEYDSDRGVLDERVAAPPAAGTGMDLSETNSYAVNRQDRANVKSRMSLSSGHVVDRSGSWYACFPLMTEQTSYNLFNNDVASSFAVNYKGETVVHGVDAYVFAGSFGFRPMVGYRVASRGLPPETTYGALKEELKESGIPLDQMIRAASPVLTEAEKRTLASFPDDFRIKLEYYVKYSWEGAVEPVSGTIVDVRRSDTHVFVKTEEEAFLPLFEILANRSEDPIVSRYLGQVAQLKLLEPRQVYRISCRWDPASTRGIAEYASGRILPIRFIKDYTLYMMLLLGAASLIAGLVIYRKHHHVPVNANGQADPDGDDTAAGG